MNERFYLDTSIWLDFFEDIAEALNNHMLPRNSKRTKVYGN